MPQEPDPDGPCSISGGRTLTPPPGLYKQPLAGASGIIWEV